MIVIDNDLTFPNLLIKDCIISNNSGTPLLFLDGVT
jgi:hypothetical protein